MDQHIGSRSQNNAAGTLYGVGVGPGSPDLLTLRAVSVLQSVSVILAAASPKNDDSLALSIASPHLPETCTVVRLDFPMTRDKSVLEAAWAENAHKVVEILQSGKNAAFLTLGDPLTYSTFGYLMRTVLKTAPDLPVSIVPGITSYQEAAARTKTILCEGEESLLLISGITRGARLRQLLSAADNAVILKAYKNIDVIKASLDDTGRAEDCIFASRLGLDNEIIGHGPESIPESPHYLSMLLAPAKRQDD